MGAFEARDTLLGFVKQLESQHERPEWSADIENFLLDVVDRVFFEEKNWVAIFAISNLASLPVPDCDYAIFFDTLHARNGELALLENKKFE